MAVRTGIRNSDKPDAQARVKAEPSWWSADKPDAQARVSASALACASGLCLAFALLAGCNKGGSSQPGAPPGGPAAKEEPAQSKADLTPVALQVQKPGIHHESFTPPGGEALNW